MIASAFRPRVDFTTSRLADISVARRKEAAGRARAAEHLRGEEEREPAAVGGALCAPVLLSVPQRVSLSQLRAWLAGLPVPDSTFPAFPRSWGSTSAERPAAGGSSKRSGSGGSSSTRTASPWVSQSICPFVANPWVPVPNR